MSTCTLLSGLTTVIAENIYNYINFRTVSLLPSPSGLTVEYFPRLNYIYICGWENHSWVFMTPVRMNSRN
jgi:hypothetical protein